MNFRTNDGVMEIFRSLNGIGNENCFFMTYKENKVDGAKYGALGAMGGAIGGAFAAATAVANGILEGIEGSDGLLINMTENGLGMVPLNFNGVPLTLNPEKMSPVLDKYVFVANEDIEQIIVKNYSFLCKKNQKVIIKLKNGKVLNQFAHKVEKNVPYHEANFIKFMNKYKNK